MMRRSMFVGGFAIVIALVASALVTTNSASGKSGGKSSPVLWAASDLKWAEAPDAPGVSEAVLWGNPKKGEYGSIARFKAGLSMPLHTHSHETRGVVISGTLVITLEGQQPKELGPGSYLMVPGKTPHTTACKEGEDCVAFAQQPGKADMILVEGTSAKK